SLVATALRSNMIGISWLSRGAAVISRSKTRRGCRTHRMAAELSISSRLVRLNRRPSEKEEAMKYMLLIHQGSTPLPGSDEWESLSDDEKNAVYGACQSINQTPGVSPGVRMGPPEIATTVRVQDGK